MDPFSVLLSLYAKEEPSNLRECLSSVFSQSLMPDEVVLVLDGPITESLDSIVRDFSTRYPILRVVTFSLNRGLGPALHDGVKECRYDVIVRMDTDDICNQERFKKQMEYLYAHPDIDLIGGQITEFIGTSDNIVGYRGVPIGHNEIMAFLKSRCPFNHMTVAFRRDAVLRCGNYEEWHYNEDYYLWIRMALAGCKFANLPDNLVNVRVGKEMYQRRGGWRYFKSEARLQRYMLNHGIISLPRYCFNTFGRFAVQVAMPNKLRGFIFQKLFRK